MSRGAAPWSSNQQPASIAVLPPPMITYPAAGSLTSVSSPTGTHVDAVGDLERRRFASQERATPCRSRRRRSVAPTRRVSAPVNVDRNRPVAEVIGHREEAHPARRQQSVTHDLVEVAADLRSRGAFVEAGVAAVGLDAVLPERGRVHAVVRRRLVQLDERIGVEPVTAGAMPPIDHHDIGVGMLDQRVDEPHPERARADDEVVGLDLGNGAHTPQT